MRRISLDKCIDGMELGKTIYSGSGSILLAEGMKLKKMYIERLKLCSISEIYIHDEFSKDIEIRDVISERTRVDAKILVKNTMEDYKKRSRFNADGAKIVVDRMIDELLTTKDIMINLSDIKTTDDYTFAHSVNVCILSLITGVKIGLNQLRMRDLGVGALLHDIGKTTIPDEILKKPACLTDEEYEIVKQHTVSGFNILKSDMNIGTTSAYVAYGHHERYDGSGYPNGAKGNDIHQFARIVAIADVFDALTSDRVYRKKFKTHEAAEYLTTGSNQLFDPEILDCFIKNIAYYAIGTSVMLDSGEKGIVVDCNSSFPTRPIVRIIYGPDGEKVSGYEEIDLTKKLNIFIIDTCDI
jgi:HD-GYP domain-containing protein (c-di-GMP phosphodiesterase class II)